MSHRLLARWIGRRNAGTQLALGIGVLAICIVVFVVVPTSRIPARAVGALFGVGLVLTLIGAGRLIPWKALGDALGSAFTFVGASPGARRLGKLLLVGGLPLAAFAFYSFQIYHPKTFRLVRFAGWEDKPFEQRKLALEEAAPRVGSIMELLPMLIGWDLQSQHDGAAQDIMWLNGVMELQRAGKAPSSSGNPAYAGLQLLDDKGVVSRAMTPLLVRGHEGATPSPPELVPASPHVPRRYRCVVSFSSRPEVTLTLENTNRFSTQLRVSGMREHSERFWLTLALVGDSAYVRAEDRVYDKKLKLEQITGKHGETPFGRDNSSRVVAVAAREVPHGT